jgi:hypothetical protein
MGKSKVVGFEIYEDIFMSLPNIIQCESCGDLIRYAGATPRKCVTCGNAILLRYVVEDVMEA